VKIGVPTEIKGQEYRVGLVPASVAEYVRSGHEVFVQRGAGRGSSIEDAEYETAGATILEDAEEVWETAEMIVKVKEPLPPEYERMRSGQIVYTYFHLAAVPELAEELLEREVTAVAYETIQDEEGRLPLLEPMSEVAGRMAIQVGAHSLEREMGGKGIMLGGVPGVRRANVVIIGAGTVGTNAAKMAVGMGAQVTLLDVDLARLRYLDDLYDNRIQTMHSNVGTLEQQVVKADLVIGAVLIPGAKAPHLVTREHVSRMSEGTVIVDVAVDQGGCIETSKPTTHEDPTYVVEGVVHYCVANMPGAVPRTSTFALNNATLRYGLSLADEGFESAIKKDPSLALGVNTCRGHVTHEAVAESLGTDYTELEDALG
jgi:alanine dehydrogenase